MVGRIAVREWPAAPGWLVVAPPCSASSRAIQALTSGPATAAAAERNACISSWCAARVLESLMSPRPPRSGTLGLFPAAAPAAAAGAAGLVPAAATDCCWATPCRELPRCCSQCGCLLLSLRQPCFWLPGMKECHPAQTPAWQSAISSVRSRFACLSMQMCM